MKRDGLAISFRLKSLGFYEHTTGATDHTSYVHSNLIFQANDKAGLRVFRFEEVDQGNIKEEAFFDTHPRDDISTMASAWSNLTFF